MVKRLSNEEVIGTAKQFMADITDEQIVAQVQEDMGMSKLEQMIMTRDGDGRVDLSDIIWGMIDSYFAGTAVHEEDGDAIVEAVRGMLDKEIAEIISKIWDEYVEGTDGLYPLTKDLVADIVDFMDNHRMSVEDAVQIVADAQ